MIMQRAGEGEGSDQIELMAASTPSKELLLPAIHVYKGQDSNHISDDAKRAKSKTRVCHQTLKSNQPEFEIVGSFDRMNLNIETRRRWSLFGGVHKFLVASSFFCQLYFRIFSIEKFPSLF